MNKSLFLIGTGIVLGSLLIGFFFWGVSVESIAYIAMFALVWIGISLMVDSCIHRHRQSPTPDPCVVLRDAITDDSTRHILIAHDDFYKRCFESSSPTF